MNYTDKRRDHLANERTFLSWIRTSLGIMALGFVIARFAVSITEQVFQRYSSWLGVAIVAIGTILSILAFVRFMAEARDIEAGAQSPSALRIVIIATALVSLSGILLIFYLLRSFH